MNEVDKLKKDIEDIELKIYEIQNYCPHPVEGVQQTNHSSYGWVKSEVPEVPEIWSTYYCTLCHKNWSGRLHELERRS